MAAPFTAPESHRARPQGLDPASVHRFVEDLVGADLHAKRVLSLANGVVGVLHGATLAIHAIGEGIAAATGVNAKHAIKEVHRMLSNLGIDVEMLAPRWVSFVLAERDEAVVALDWTDFDGDDQTTLVLNVITNRGRATPLLWKTVPKKGLKTKRNGYEDEQLVRLREAVPVEIRVTVLADRGFGDQKFYGRRFTIEENLRDTKDLHLGRGPLGHAHPGPRPPLVAGLLRDLAAGTDAMAALPRVDHLAQLVDRALELRDPRIALAKLLLQLGDALGVGHAASRDLGAPEKQGLRERPAGERAVAHRDARLIELNRVAARTHGRLGFSG